MRHSRAVDPYLHLPLPWCRRAALLVLMVLALGSPVDAATWFVWNEAIDYCTDSATLTEIGPACTADAECSLCYDDSVPAETNGVLCVLDEDCTVGGFTLCQTPGVCGGQAATGSIQLPFDTIAAGMDAASNGDTVQVLTGTYVEDVITKTGVSLVGSGSDVTTIDGLGNGPVVLFNFLSADGAGDRLEGFKITGGGGRRGGGIRIIFGSPTITSNLITENHVTVTTLGLPAGGGGIYVGDGSPFITGNVIEGNTVISDTLDPAKGGGIYILRAVPFISNNIIRHNVVGEAPPGSGPDNGGNGGGIFTLASNTTITRNLVCGNTAWVKKDLTSTYLFGYGGGLELQAGYPRVADNLIIGNSAGLGGAGIDIFLTGATVVNNTIHGNDVEAQLLDLNAPAGFSHGGGMEIVNATPTVFNNLITSNR
ncbi:MAG: hypothetical protein E2P04_04560, partial [Acidobacteria bacterium]